MSEVRNLVVGCDGTWNEPEQLSEGVSAPTNVVKLVRSMASLGGRQVVHYEEGVGTRGWESLPGGIYGQGLDKRILGSYRFLRKRFADRRWDRDQNKVFLFGFSRGAYTVRRLSGLIAHSGIPVKAEDAALGWEIYKERDQRSAAALRREKRFFDIPIEMIGVWDTVKATNDADYHDKKLSSNVVAGYHAMAIDERRKFFPVLRWNRDPRALQLWFAGVHSDVGGGYSNAGLADVSLRWMIEQAFKHGLQFKAESIRENVKPRPTAAMHESLEGHWALLGEKLRSIPKTSLVHDSVRKRMESQASYRPANLPVEPVYWQA